MGNPKSAWSFSASSLDLAAKYDHFALRICAVDLKNEPLAAGALIKTKTCLARAKISVEVADIKVEPIRDGAKSTLQDIFVVAKLLPKAPKMLQLVCSGPPGADTFFYLGEISGIPSKGAYPPRSKAANLPFNGATFIPVAFVRSALCLTEAYGAERDSHMQNQVLVPALTARLDVEVAEKKKTMAEHEVKATDVASNATAGLIACRSFTML